MIFLPKSISPEAIKFEAPYDCEFIIAYPHLNIYKLDEVYDLDDYIGVASTVRSEYGTWDPENGLNITNKSVYYRRTDMNQTYFTANKQNFDFEVSL